MLKWIDDYVDLSEGLDFWTKYSIIISNFVLILVLLIFKKVQKKSQN